MGISGDGVQQFVDKLVDEGHRSSSIVDFLETTSLRPRSEPSTAAARVAVPGRWSAATPRQRPMNGARAGLGDRI
jgi:hypothetical protein